MPSKKKLADAIRVLSMDAVQQANSGHPGAPMGIADMAVVLWDEFMKHNPGDPTWPDRDRFVLSNGHGSMLLYSLLHLTGYNLPMEEIKNFRQLGSKTPGHPEYGHTPGVETTTGPLGQGLCNAVGMALAEQLLADEFNRPGHAIVDHYTYTILGDGCMMEGISHEACSLAGTLGLGKLIALYDDNGISIDGEVKDWFADDTPQRFRAYGWHVIPDVDGHDHEAVAKALAEAKAETSKPTLICCKTIIACGSPNACGKSSSHGSPLGTEEIDATRKSLDWDHPPFEIPKEVYEALDARSKGAATQSDWEKNFAEYEKDYPDAAAEFRRRMRGDMPRNWEDDIQNFMYAAAENTDRFATRKSSQFALNGLGPVLPDLFGGSADLTPSNGTLWKGSKSFNHREKGANYLYYGVREFAMGGIMNGMALHGGFIPYAGTFLVFSDYARNAIRMAALMELRLIWVLTHDSIGVGEDGPTHQPVEHTASLRLIPNLNVFRPCDTLETAVAWKTAVESTTTPSALILTRQKLKVLDRTPVDAENIARGGYILKDTDGTPDGLIIATGSEVGPALEAAEALEEDGKKIRVVSMPCVEIFEAQNREYRDAVIPPAVTIRLVAEAGTTACWRGYAGPEGMVLGLDRFGASAPGGQLFKHFGLTAEDFTAALRGLFA